MNRILKIFLLSVTALTTACNTETETSASEQAINVVAEPVSEYSFANQIHLSGFATGQSNVKLGFMVAGKIKSIYVKEGSEIKKGQLIAELDAESYQLAETIAQAKLKEVADEYNRLSEMHKAGSISESDYVKISSGYQQAKANYQLQQKNLKDTRLYAPISGTLLRKGAEEGEITGSGMPVFVIGTTNPMQISASVPAPERKYVTIGDTAQVYISALDSTFTGTVDIIGTNAEPTTRSFTVKINIPNEAGLVLSGMIAEVTIHTRQQTKGFALPPSAVLEAEDHTNYVFIADEGKQKAFKKSVTTGDLTGNKIRITSGLTKGELVVTEGNTKLEDGALISLKK